MMQLAARTLIKFGWHAAFVMSIGFMAGCQTSETPINDILGDENTPGHANEMTQAGQDVGETTDSAKTDDQGQKNSAKNDEQGQKPSETETAAAESEEPTSVFGMRKEASGDCDKVIIGMSEHAVGNPCMTTETFMRDELQLPDQKIAWVQRYQDQVGNPVAH